LDIVNEQDVHPSKFISELIHLFITEGVDQLIGELFRGDVTDLLHIRKNTMMDEMVSDGVKKMGLPQPHPSIDKEGIVILRR
jgi:hypothetical protein